MGRAVFVQTSNEQTTKQSKRAIYKTTLIKILLSFPSSSPPFALPFFPRVYYSHKHNKYRGCGWVIIESK